MQTISDEDLEFQLLVEAFGEPGAKPIVEVEVIDEPIIEIEKRDSKGLAPKETYQEWKARREITAHEEYIASRHASIPKITPEQVVEVEVIAPIVEAKEVPIEAPIVKAEVEEVTPTKASKGKSKDGLFIKTGIGMLRGTLIKDLGAPCFATLMVISSYMDNKGVCYPAQETIAEILGISRETVNRQIKKLLRYRTPEGLPILQVKKIKIPGMPYARASYLLLPVSGLSFG